MTLNKDNLMHVVKIVNSLTAVGAATPTNHGVSLNIPRGHVARIRKLIRTVTFGDTFDQAINLFMNIQSALVRDPDDDQTTQMPTDQVGHDVIAEFQQILIGRASLTITDGAFFIEAQENKQIIDFSEDLDVITARDMNYNTEKSQHIANFEINDILLVYFTYEKVTSKDLLDMLDIL